MSITRSTMLHLHEGGVVILDAEDLAWARLRRWREWRTPEGEHAIISVADGPRVNLAHLIAEIATGEPGRGRAVAYDDGNPFNLTRANTHWQELAFSRRNVA
jgi:hypothetical protein